MAENSFESAVAYIDSIPRFTKKNDAGNTRKLLDLLGNPDRGLSIIHVAGTNGKGSTCAFLESIYRTAGLRTGLFTSPHLIRLTERFQIDRKEVSQETFLKAYREVMEGVRAMEREGFAHPTFFELLFVIAMVIFREEKVDLVVLETGLGGRLDATNVTDPLLSVITSISLDHTAYLGSTVREIAFEKAGIIKKNVPVVYDDGEEAGEVIEKRAREMGSFPIPFRREYAKIDAYGERSIAFTLKIPPFLGKTGEKQEIREIRAEVPFLADYQVLNASLAMMAALALWEKISVSERDLLEGIRTAHWSGRMEVLEGGVVVDGAHNEEGMRQFLHAVKRIRRDRPAALLFGVLADKDYESMVREICRERLFDFVVTVTGKTPRALPAEDLRDLFLKEGAGNVYSRETALEGLALCKSLRPEGGLLFCAGSLYLAGEILAADRERAGGKDDQL